MKPLAGLKVIELARILAGPWAGQVLADLGADVIKIESPAGDDTRTWGPPNIGKDAAYFHCCNRGKSSVVVDFRTQTGQATIRKMIADADILIENFKVGGLAKYGLDYAALSAVNPRLIYASITGFGQDGPYAQRAGYDYIIQGMSGLMSVTGEPAGQPQKVGVAVTDVFTGMYAATSILAAVHQRRTTGRGQHLDLALLDVATAVMANQAMNYLATGTSPARLGNAHPNIVPYQVFDCADGHIIIACGNDSQFTNLCVALGCDDLSVQYSTNPERVAARAVVTDALTLKTRMIKKTDLLALCQASGVPAGPINTMAEVFADPQIIARGLQIDLDGIPGVGFPVKFSDAEVGATRPSPKLGANRKPE